MRLRKLTRRALPSAIYECMSVQDMADNASTTPSSTLIKMFPSGLSAIAAIFLRFWKGKVNDLLLRTSTVSRLHAQATGDNDQLT